MAEAASGRWQPAAGTGGSGVGTPAAVALEDWSAALPQEYRSASPRLLLPSTYHNLITVAERPTDASTRFVIMDLDP